MSINPVEIPTGAVRFNTDSSNMEVYIGDTWMEVAVSSPDLDGGDRGIFATGVNGGNVIDFVTIASTGNATDFGDNYDVDYESASASSRTRGVTMGGRDPSPDSRINICAFVTISSTGDAQDFGDLTVKRSHAAGVSNQTRGVAAGGYQAPNDAMSEVIDFITIASTGNAVDFGDLITGTAFMGTGRNNPTRGVFVAGITPSATNTMSFVTIASTGNATDFGDSFVDDYGQGGGNASNAVRSILAGSNNPSGAPLNSISFFSVNTLGNAQDFGDLATGKRGAGAVASRTRAVFGGGRTPNDSNIISYVEIATQGNSVDFGDLTVARSFNNAGLSNGHGGL